MLYDDDDDDGHQEIEYDRDGPTADVQLPYMFSYLIHIFMNSKDTVCLYVCLSVCLSVCGIHHWLVLFLSVTMLLLVG